MPWQKYRRFPVHNQRLLVSAAQQFYQHCVFNTFFQYLNLQILVLCSLIIKASKDFLKALFNWILPLRDILQSQDIFLQCHIPFLHLVFFLPSLVRALPLSVDFGTGNYAGQWFTSIQLLAFIRSSKLHSCDYKLWGISSEVIFFLLQKNVTKSTLG